MKKIKLIPIETEEEFDGCEDIGAGEGLRFGFDLTPYLITCAIACGILFVARFVEKHILHMR